MKSIKLSLMSTYILRKILISHQNKINLASEHDKMEVLIDIEKILLNASKDGNDYVILINQLETLLRMYQVLSAQNKNMEIQNIEDQILRSLF